MREILFRGKTINTGRWVYGVPIKDDKREVFICGAYSLNGIKDYQGNVSILCDRVLKVMPESLGEYTDYKNICENDIIKFKGHLFRICYEHSSPVLAKINNSTNMYDIFEDCWNDHVYPLSQYIWNHGEDDYEVIGNIHDNPELLEVG